jgi:integrase
MAQYAVYTMAGRKRKTIYSKTRKDVAARLATALSDREGGLVFDAGTLTVEEYLERWLSDCVRDTVKASTYSSYKQLANKHAVPTLGRIRLKTLTATHVRGLLREKLDAGLSPRTVQYVRFVLRKALDQAVADNLIPRNPVAGVKSPQVRREEIRPLSPEQARLFLRTAAETSDRLEALYVVAIHCGLRQGELLALKWEDLDLEAGTLQVRRSLSGSNDGHPVFTTPKTSKSRRQVRLTAGATETLKRHRRRQLEERLRIVGLWRDNDLVFTAETGTPLDRHNLCQRSFKPLLEKAGLSGIRFHDLRHTCATLLLTKGVHPKIVQELLGHSTIAITLDTYSHVLPGMGDAAAGAMDEALG